MAQKAETFGDIPEEYPKKKELSIPQNIAIALAIIMIVAVIFWAIYEFSIKR